MSCMSIARGVLAQASVPGAHDKVLDNNPELIGVWKWLVFEERGKQQTQPTYDAESGNRTRATLVGGEYSTTAPCLFFPRQCLSKTLFRNLYLNILTSECHLHRIKSWTNIM